MLWGALIGLRELPPRLHAPSDGFSLDFLSRNHIAGVDTDLHLASEPSVMLGGFLLLSHEVSHELRTGTVMGFRSRGELVFPGLIDPEGEGCFVHGDGFLCYEFNT